MGAAGNCLGGGSERGEIVCEDLGGVWRILLAEKRGAERKGRNAVDGIKGGARTGGVGAAGEVAAGGDVQGHETAWYVGDSRRKGEVANVWGRE